MPLASDPGMPNSAAVNEYVHRIVAWAKSGYHSNREVVHKGPAGHRECRHPKLCVHPDHLGWATHSANVKHGYKKRKRQPMGQEDIAFGV
jgi:hypothetical protein